MKIGIIIGRIGGVDGVALETEKWIEVLKKLGHEVFILTGRLEKSMKNVTMVPEMDFHHPLTNREQDDAFFVQKVKESTLISRIERNTDYLESEILRWIIRTKLDVILTENCSALPCHLSLGIALKKVLDRTEMPTVSHDHDFYWERGTRYKSKYRYVKNMIGECFPPTHKHVKHAVINSHAASELRKRFDLNSVVVPNVMDFKQPFGLADNYTRTMDKALDLKVSDIVLFQVTRIVRRKGIEVAIKLLHELDDPNIKLVITGSTNDDYSDAYYTELVDQIDKLNLHDRVKFASSHFKYGRYIEKQPLSEYTNQSLKKSHTKRRVYSLSDAYSRADACTYFSTYEGFGNAFVECILAKRPIFVNNYSPVYWPDIGKHGFETVMLQNNRLTASALTKIKHILYNKKMAKEMAEHNFKLGKKLFSYEVLAQHLSQLFKGF